MFGTLTEGAQEYSVVLVIPDFYDRFYVELLANILLVQMGFKQLCAQQVTYQTVVCSARAHFHCCRNP